IDDTIDLVHHLGADAVAGQHEDLFVGPHLAVSPRPSLPLKGGGEEKAAVGKPPPPLRGGVGVGGSRPPMPADAAHDQSHGWFIRCFSSNASIAGPFSKVRPTSSRPCKRQRLRNGSMSNLMQPPSGPLISCFSRSMLTMALAPRSASSMSLSTSACGSWTGRMPFLKQLL